MHISEPGTFIDTIGVKFDTRL